MIGSKGVPEIERVVKDGTNGYLIDRNLTDVDSEKIDEIFDTPLRRPSILSMLDIEDGIKRKKRSLRWGFIKQLILPVRNLTGRINCFTSTRLMPLSFFAVWFTAPRWPSSCPHGADGGRLRIHWSGKR